MSRTLTINQTYHANGCMIYAQLDPHPKAPAHALTLYVQEGGDKSALFRRFDARWLDDQWQVEFANEIPWIQDWASQQGDNIYNGLI